MIPPEPPEGSTHSEKRVFRLLAQASLGQDAYALSSLNLAEHEYQRWGEIDFVLAMEIGLLAIEVKGGSVDCINGVWTFEDRTGRVVTKRTSPIAQAQAGYSSMLKRYLEPALPAVAAKAVSGFCALFPAANRSSVTHLVGGPEMPRELVGTKEDCVNSVSIQAFIRRVMTYWAAHKKRGPSTLKSEEVRQIVAVLRPSFDRVAPLSLSLRRVRDEQLSLTSDQYRILDFIEGNQRILCTGGAGSGKTFVAMECLRRERQFNPVLVTGTDMLAQHLRAGNPAEAERIFSYAELVVARVRLHGTFASVIVDEGQQITSAAAIELFSDILGQPFQTARWRWFADPNFQVSSTSDFDAGLQLELERWALAKGTLPHNCRNTPQIINAVEFLSGAAIGSTRVKGRGPEVEYAKDAGHSAVVRAAATRIREWVERDQIPAGDIVLLSMLPIAQSSIPEIARAAGFDYANWKPGWDLRSNYPNVLGASTIEEFRGIEAPATILCDIAGSAHDIQQAFYLGMTRANFGMFVASDPALLQEFMAERLQLSQRHL